MIEEHTSTEKSIFLLVVDDDQEIRDLMADYLRQHGFQTATASDGDTMFAAIKDHRPDLVVLDIMMPGEDGLSLCKRLRASGDNIPIIFLTALGDSTDRVVGLELGADDYVVKPFQPRELLARIRAVLRRTGQLKTSIEDKNSSQKTWRFNGWTLDTTARHLISPDGIIVNLSGAEYRLLTIFLEHPQKVLSRDFIQDKMQGQEIDRSPFDRSLDVQICRLRARLRDTGGGRENKLIKTIRGDGYIFTCNITTDHS